MKPLRLLATAALAVAMGTTAQAQDKTVKIGVVLPYSGANADLGHQIDKAFDLYVKLHAKDIAPLKVQLIKRDEGPPTGAQAKTVATELITNDKVPVLAGFVFSPSSIALAPVVTQAKVPMIIANAGTAWITDLSPYIVRLSFSMWHPAYPMGGYAYDKLNCKTAAVAYTDFPRGRTRLRRSRPASRRPAARSTLSIPMGSPVQVPDFTPFMQRVKDAHPDCLYAFIPSGAHATGLMKAYGEVGLKKAGIRLIGPMDLIPDNKLQDMGDAAIGTVVMGHYAVDLESPANKEFKEEWHKAYGADSYPDFMSAAGWDTMHAIFDTIKKLNGDLSDGMKVVNAMKGWKADGPRGPVQIDPDTRDIIQNEHAMEVYRKPDGKLGERILGTTENVKDECKVLKVGRCK